ncbi:hypothetical protein Peur_011186 [Populus x canadensis]
MLGRLLDLQEQWRHFFSSRRRRQRSGSKWICSKPSFPSLAGGDKQRHLQSKGNTTNRQFCSVLDMFKAFFSSRLVFSFCRWHIWLLMSSRAAEAAMDMGGGCLVRGFGWKWI